jgi:arylsulfatase A-like enzyme
MKVRKLISFPILILISLGYSTIFSNIAVPKVKIKKTSDLNVLLITIDTIRADRVGYSGAEIETPNLDSLAYGGARFMNAVCQVPLTLPSHASILTGTNPTYHQIKGNGPFYLDEEFTMLPEILKERDYLTAAFVGSYVLDSEFGMSQGFEFYDDDFLTPDFFVKERKAEDVFNSVAEWLGKNYGEKHFIWVHYFDPHDPYKPPPPFDTKYKTRPYEGEIVYTDVYVGKLIDLLKTKGIYDNTIVIIVGDHGEDLFDHREPTHGIFLYDSTIKVPLIFHGPGIIPKGLSIEKQVRTIDIFPTVLDILKIDIPTFCQGESLVPVLEGKKVKQLEESYSETYYPLTSYGWSELKSIRTDKWKYIHAPEQELYDLVNDPKEKRNVIEENKKVARNLTKKLENMEKRTSSGAKSKTRELTQQDEEKLRALGYVGGTLPSKSESGKA